MALDAGRALLDSEVATKVAAGLTGLSNGFGAGGNSEIRQCRRACRYSRYFMYAPVCMSDEARIRELVALIDAEKDPQKVKTLATELERLLTVNRTPWPAQEEPGIS